MVEMYQTWVNEYPVIVLEDGLAEDDWDGWKLLNRTLGGKIELVGDNLLVTNVERIARGISENVGEPGPDQTESDRHVDRDHCCH